MTDTTETLPSEQEPQGLDAIINSAIETHYVEPGDAPKKEEAAPAETPESRARDEKGRFAPKDKVEAKPSEGAAEAPAQPAEVTQPDPAPAPVEAPRNFTADIKAKFAALPPEAQAIVNEVEKAREAEYTRRSQEIAEYRRTADPLVEAVRPFADYLSQIAPQVGQTPVGMISSILAAEYQLRTAPLPQRYQAFVQLAQQYGIDPAAFAGGQVPAQPQPTQNYADPRLHQQLAELQQWRVEQQREKELQHSVQQIDAFSAEKDEAGQAKHPYFDRVRHVMASIIQSGQADNLNDAYRLATQPIQDVIDKEIKARQEAVEKERQAALEKAKKATPVRTSSGALPKGATQAKGIDAHIAAAMEKAGF